MENFISIKCFIELIINKSKNLESDQVLGIRMWNNDIQARN